MPKNNRPLTLVALLLAMFLAAMEATVVATAMPSVVADLHGLELYGWVGAVYMLSGTVSMPLFGKVADVVGRKPVLLGALGVFLVGSILSGFSRSMVELIAFRAVQGLGAGGIQPIALTIVGDLYRPQERGRVQGLFGALWGVAGVAGPLVGGLLVHALSWRWVFFINIPFCVFSGATLIYAFREGVVSREARFDLLGALVLSGAVIALLLGASRVHPSVTLPLALGLVALFVLVESRAPEPLLPPALFGRRVILVSSVAGALFGAVTTTTITYLPLFTQAVLGGTPTESGLVIAPMLVAWPISSTVSGRNVTRLGYHTLVRSGFAVISLAAVAIYLVLLRGPTIGRLGACMALLGVGLGLAHTAMVIAVQESAAWNERGIATASTMFFRTIGGAIGTGALGAMLASQVARRASPELLNKLLGPEHGRGIEPAALAALGVDLAIGVQHVFAVVLGLAAAAFVVSLFFPAGRPRAPEASEAPPLPE